MQGRSLPVNHRMELMFAVEANRTASVQKGVWVQVQRLDVPNEGCMVWLRNFGQVKLFRARPKDPLRYDVVGLPDGQGDSTFARLDFQKRHDQHWGIEQYHRMLKQVCNVERSIFQFRYEPEAGLSRCPSAGWLDRVKTGSLRAWVRAF